MVLKKEIVEKGKNTGLTFKMLQVSPSPVVMDMLEDDLTSRNQVDGTIVALCILVAENESRSQDGKRIE